MVNKGNNIFYAKKKELKKTIRPITEEKSPSLFQLRLGVDRAREANNSNLKILIYKTKLNELETNIINLDKNFESI